MCIKRELLYGKNSEAQEEISWTHCAVSQNDVFKQKRHKHLPGITGVISYTTPRQEDGLDAS